MATAKLPTGFKPDSGRFQGGGLRLLEGARHPDPPDPPGHLDKRERALFRQAWAEPEATLWRRSDAARVARWVVLSARAETDPVAWVFSALSAIERQLLMTPLSRAAAGVTIEAAGVAATGSKDRSRSKLCELRKLRRDDPLGALDDDEVEAVS